MVDCRRRENKNKAICSGRKKPYLCEFGAYASLTNLEGGINIKRGNDC